MKTRILIFLASVFVVEGAAAQDPRDKIKEIERVEAELERLRAEFKRTMAELEKTRLQMQQLQDKIDDSELRLHEYINLALPRPEGSGLPGSAADGSNPAQEFNTKLAKQAVELLEKKRFGDLDPKREEFIRNHLTQVNLEAVSLKFAPDLSRFYATLAADEKQRFIGMNDDEKRKLIATARGQDEGLPKAGWIVEIRGYTYHRAQSKFVLNTFLENLKRFGDGKVLIKKIAGQKIHFFKLGENMTQEVVMSIAENVRIKQQKSDGAYVVLEKGLKDPIFSRRSVLCKLVVENLYAKEEDRKIAEIILDNDSPLPGRTETRMELIADKVVRKTSLMMVYKMEVIENPVPGEFRLIGPVR